LRAEDEKNIAGHGAEAGVAGDDSEDSASDYRAADIERAALEEKWNQAPGAAHVLLVGLSERPSQYGPLNRLSDLYNSNLSGPSRRCCDAGHASPDRREYRIILISHVRERRRKTCHALSPIPMCIERCIHAGLRIEITSSENLSFPGIAISAEPPRRYYWQVSVSRRNAPLAHPVPSIGRWVK